MRTGTNKGQSKGVQLHGHKINYLKSGDDIDLSEETRDGLQRKFKRIIEGLTLTLGGEALTCEAERHHK